MTGRITEEVTFAVIVNGVVCTPQEVIANGVVVIAGGQIQAVDHQAKVSIPAQAKVFDAMGQHVIPGLIDLHIHGLEGQDAMLDAGVTNMAPRLAHYGVTAFLPTVTPAPLPELEERLAAVAEAVVQRPQGAKPLGIHLEGPFLSPQQPGMMNAAHFRPFAEAEFERMWTAAQGLLRMVTLAPEEADNMRAIPHLLDRGIVPSIGHSNATFMQVTEAVRRGLTHASHTYNAMRGFHHREPGVVGGVWLHPQITAQVIGDGTHVHPAGLQILLQIKGVDGVALVSDATLLAGLPPGEYQWEGETVIVDSRSARLTNGTLAGSTVLLNQGLRTLTEEVRLPLEEALVTVTRTPARALGLPKGELAPGYDADLVILDADLRPLLTMVEGEVVFRSPDLGGH